MENLKKLRRQNKKTLKEIAEICQIPISTYNSYELGNNEPKYATLLKLADYFQVSTDYLLERKQTYKIDLSNLTETQKNIIKMIPDLTDLNCERVEAYITAKLEEQEEFKQNKGIK